MYLRKALVIFYSLIVGVNENKSLYRRKQNKKKTMKWILILILTLLVIPLVYAIEECKDIQIVKEIPCQITATWNYTLPCSSNNATVYNSSNNNVINYTFQTLGESPLCVFEWNITSLDSYSYTINNGIDGAIGDTGNITVAREDSMIAVMIGLVFVMIFFAVFGFMFEKWGAKIFGYGVALIQMLNIVYIMYINELNMSLAPILRINFISILWLAFGVGMISLFRLVISLVNVGEDEDNPTPENKWGRG